MSQSDFAAPSRLSRWLERWCMASKRRTIAAAAVLAAAAALYYPLGMLLIHRIDDDIAFSAAAENGASHAVAITAALIERETDRYGWTANSPLFLPAAALDNMPEYQQGIVMALARFVTEMTDQIGRMRGSSQADSDLEKAAGLLKYPGTVWLFDFSTSWAPTASSESQYRAARRALLNYNQRLVAHEAVFERRADNLIAILERFAADLGSASAILSRQIHEGRSRLLFDTRADNVFYGIKGKLYAYYLLLRELRADFQALLNEREADNAWSQLLLSLEEAVQLEPLLVLNAAPDGLFAANHLAVQGFYLLRARTQLREIASILQK